MLITVQELNPPRNGRGPWGVKDSQAQWWKLWDREKTALNIQVGGTYEVEFKAEEYNGKTQRTITKATTKAGPSAAIPPAKNQYQFSKNPTESRQIAVLAMVKPWIEKIPVGDVEAAIHAVQAMLEVYDRTFAGAQAQRRDDLDDTIPY